MAISRAVPLISSSRRKSLTKKLISAASPDIDFYVLIGLSAIIVTLGLIVDSSPVVIGGMLIAPLFEPIMATAIAVVTGRIGALKRAGWTILQVIFGVVAVAMLVSVFSPFKNIPGEEILSRTDPNLIHLFIALFSGVTGAFAILWPRVTSSLVGVLIATALLPPLAVVGHSLVASDVGAAIGALLLFLTNLVVVVFASTVMLLLFGFRPSHRDDKKDDVLLAQEIRVAVVVIFLLAIPLTYSLIAVVAQNNRVSVVEQAILVSLPQIDQKDLTQLEVESKKEGIEIRATLATGSTISQDDLSDIKTSLRKSLKRPIVLDLTILPVVRLVQ